MMEGMEGDKMAGYLNVTGVDTKESIEPALHLGDYLGPAVGFVLLVIAVLDTSIRSFIIYYIRNVAEKDRPINGMILTEQVRIRSTSSYDLVLINVCFHHHFLLQ